MRLWNRKVLADYRNLLQNRKVQSVLAGGRLGFNSVDRSGYNTGKNQGDYEFFRHREIIHLLHEAFG